MPRARTRTLPRLRVMLTLTVFFVSMWMLCLAEVATDTGTTADKQKSPQQNDEDNEQHVRDEQPDKKVEYAEKVYDADRVVLLNADREAGPSEPKIEHYESEPDSEEPDPDQEQDETDDDQFVTHEEFDRQHRHADVEEDGEQVENEEQEAEEQEDEGHMPGYQPPETKHSDRVLSDFNYDSPDDDDMTATSAQASDVALTPEQQRAKALYDQAHAALQKSKQAHQKILIKAAYRMMDEAAAANHTLAMEIIAMAHLFGDHMPWNIRRAREIFEDLSMRGSARAQLGLAFMHSAGVAYGTSSQAKALVYYTFAALAGNPLAQMALGYRYYSGINVESNCETALIWYRKVARQVSDEVKVGTGIAVQRIRLPDELEQASGTTQSSATTMDDNLLQYYKFLADKGDLQAQVGLGQLYLTGGRGVEQNFQQAFHYFTEAAEAGSANAYAYLGKMYLDGSPSTPQDNTTAYQYFKRAADKNNPVGQSGLGVMYLYGKGVNRDYNKALRYFTLAAEQGWVDGQLNLGHMHFNGLGVRRDYKLAIKYFQLASQAGHVLAFYNLAQIHAAGTGTPRNCQMAVELFKNVAERGKWSSRLMEAHTMYKDGQVDEAALKYLFLAELGYEVAQTNVAYLLDKSLVKLFASTEYKERALLQWQRSAAQGYALARVKLGDYHYYGWGTPIDYERAAQHYKIASEQQHNAQAMFNLGYMHEQGLGIKQDIHLAKRFYDMAAETSTDAEVPVALAMFKLGAMFAFTYLREQPLWRLAPLDEWFGADWDLYAMTALLGLLIILVYAWWQRR